MYTAIKDLINEMINLDNFYIQRAMKQRTKKFMRNTRIRECGLWKIKRLKIHAACWCIHIRNDFI